MQEVEGSGEGIPQRESKQENDEPRLDHKDQVEGDSTSPQKDDKDLDQRKEEQFRKDQGLIEKVRGRLRSLTDAPRREAWEAMGETDQLATVTQKLEGRIGPDEAGFTAEILSGSPRTEVGKPEGGDVVVVAESMDQARDIKRILPEQQVLAADSRYLPFKEESLQRVVDPHKASEVGEKEWGSPFKNATYLFSELRAFLKEKMGRPGFLAYRPVYIESETHEQLVDQFKESLMSRAQILKPDGKLIFSVGARPEDWNPESAYMAIQKRVGEVVLSPSEVKQLVQESGLQIEEVYAGMASRSQLIHTENVVKALVMSVTGGRFDRFSQEILIPAAHAAWNFVGRPREIGKELTPDQIRSEINLQRVDLDNFGQSRPSGPAGARMKEGETKPPDRVIIVASKR